MTRVVRVSALYGWLASEAVSLTGTRVTMVAVPWLVLTTTGSATRTGLVAFCEMLPYVVAKAFGGPLVDRLGARRVCVTADLLSVPVVGAVPLLHTAGALTFPALCAVVAVAGLLRGPGDGAKHALVPEVVARAGVPLERATGLGGAVERLASTVGAAFAGLLVAAVGPAQALLVDAASFGASALLLLVLVPASRASSAEGGGYLTSLREGAAFLRREEVLLVLTAMVWATNLLDAAYAGVLTPVWAEESGRGAEAVGLLFGTFSAAAVLGSVLASRWGDRLPRFRVYVVAFALAGLPRFAAMAADVAWGTGLAPVLAVATVGGFGAGFINPILGAVIYERIPAAMTGRVTSLTSALCWAGIPFGGLLGGVLVTWVGIAPALLVVGSAYAVATLSPLLLPALRRMDRPSAAAVPVPVPAQASSGNQIPISRSADSGESEPWTRFSRLDSE